MGLRMAIASPKEIDRSFDLARLFEETVDRRWHCLPNIDGNDYNEDEEVYLRKFYEKCKELSPGLMRVVFGYQVLLDNCCDKTADHLTLHPGMQAKIDAGERSIARMMAVLRDMNSCC
ncbi:MAG: hypothetical protein KAV87_55480 [Desulfobacteraceae bacterium]|nr:hypothetical protein [Desulfobacteraceae bacterium]